MTTLVALVAALLSSSAPSVPLAACTLSHPSGTKLQARCGAVSVTVGTTPIELAFAVVSSASAEPSLQYCISHDAGKNPRRASAA
jgi:hypothetical protein